MAEEKTKLKKYWAEQAVSLALQGRWNDAVTANQNILALFPSDAEAHNRLGKAYTELGRYADAKNSYEHALQIDPNNTIAEKKLQRLAHLVSSSPADGPTPPPEEAIAPQIFIEEMGKTGTTVLQNPAGLTVLARMSAGDPVRLQVEGNTLVVYNGRSERLGNLETKLGQRLIRMMNNGNRYAAAIQSLENSARIIIRETYQHPSQIGIISFPIKGADSSYRSDIRTSVLKYDLDDDDDDGADEAELSTEGEAAVDDGSDEPEPFEEDMGNSPGDDK